MDRRLLLTSSLALAGAELLPKAAQAAVDDLPQPAIARPAYPARDEPQTYSHDELIHTVSDFFGVPSEAAAGIVEKIFRDNGRPTAYIAGEEGSGAFVFGLRYGKGLLYMKEKPTQRVFWRGPTVGFDAGGNGSRVLTLC